MTEQTPAPPPEGAPEISAEAAAMRAVQIGRVTFDDIWQMCSRYCEHKTTWARIASENPTSVGIGIVFDLAKERDIYFGICRLVELIKDDPLVRERIADLARDEREAAQAAIEDHESKDAA